MDLHPLANLFKRSNYDEPIASELSALDYLYEVLLEIRESKNCDEVLKEENYKVRVTDDVKNLDVQDYIFISIKAHGITNIADSIKRIMSDETAIISAVKGLPWWYFYKANTGTDNSFARAFKP